MKRYTKRYIGTLFAIMVGLLSCQVFAENEPCTTSNGSFYNCTAGQICNNVQGGTCYCKNSYFIQNHSKCYADRLGKIINVREATAYAISGSQIVFYFDINNTNGDKFVLNLPNLVGTNPRIKITAFDPNGIINGNNIILYQGFLNPEYHLDHNEDRTIVITGELVTSTYNFTQFDSIYAAVYRNGQATNIDSVVNMPIIPMADLSLSQSIVGTFPTSVGSNAVYKYIVKNIGAIANTASTLKNYLDTRFFGAPTFASVNIPALQPGQEHIVNITGTINQFLPALTVVANTGTVTTGSSEFSNRNNLSVLNYTIPIYIDLLVSSVNTGFEQPEFSGDVIGFTINYTNSGNYTATGVYINAAISGVLANTRFDLPDLTGGESRSITITGRVGDYPIGTRFCLSGYISGSNETAGLGNNVLPQYCYTFVDHADIKLTADLTESQANIVSSGQILHYTMHLANIGGKKADGVRLYKELSPNLILQSTGGFSRPYSVNPGETIDIPVVVKLVGYPVALTHIMLSGTASFDGIEPNKTNNSFVLNTTIRERLDLYVASVSKINEEPESVGDKIGFSVIYGNSGNIDAKDLKLVLRLSNFIGGAASTEYPIKDLEMNTTGSFIFTESIDREFPVGTKFCLSGVLVGKNETAGIRNNILPEKCYTFVNHADVVATATLQESPSSIHSGDTLHYNIKLENIGGKTASGIVLRKEISNNMVFVGGHNFDEEENALSDDGSESGEGGKSNKSQTKADKKTTYSLNPGESINIPVNTKLISYPAQGARIMLSGTAVFTGIESNKENNSFVLTNNLLGLSDVYITHTQLPFSGFKKGDKVTYVINYGNSGFDQAWTPIVRLVLPSILDAEQTERTLGKSISAGDSGSIIVEATLNQFLAAGTAFSSQASISTESIQITTSNDKSIITGTIGEFNNFAFDVSARNITHLDLNGTNIGAISGDVIEFTVSYANNGNVEGTNAIIGFNNIDRIAGLSFDGNIGTLSVDESGSFTTTGRIIGGNFDPINVIAHLRYNNTGDITDSVTITEPYSCGDGYITKDEPCDPNTTNNNLLTGQVCESQAGRCTIVTRFVTNTACVDFYGYHKCYTTDPIWLEPAMCLDTILVKQSGMRTDVTCIGQYAGTTTLASIDCGNGATTRYLTGFADAEGHFFRTCSYSNNESWEYAQVQCGFGTDNNNSDCKKRLDGCEMRSNPQIVIIDDEDGDDARVTCNTNNNKEARITINCNNEDNDKRTSDNYEKTFSHECNYTQEDYDDHDGEVEATCEIDGTEACSTDIILDKGIFGVCGDGDLDAYEQCDLGDNGEIIGTWLDEEHSERADSEDKGKKCNHCSIEDHDSDYTCLSINNANISVQNNELLPFWWRMYDNGQNFTTNNSCNHSNEGKIKKDSMECQIEIIAPNGNTKTIYTDKCDKNQWVNAPIFEYFKPFMNQFNLPFGKYIIDLNQLSSFIDDKFGEYKIRINEVNYDYCYFDEEDDDYKWENSQTDNVCETNFVITRPYLVQKSAFSTTPKSSTINLDNFYDINNNKLINRTDLASISILDTSEYAGSYGTIHTMMQNFATKTKKLAAAVNKNSLPNTLKNQNITVKKVPNKDIYVLSANTQTNLNLNEFADITKPFTIITEKINLIINADISVNGMFVVNDGSITFSGGCNQTQVVKGIFVAGNGFNGTKNINDSLNKSWCNAGGLNVKGVLIGNGLESLVKNRRSSLSNWFNVSGGENSQKVQRRNQIFRGAAVLIEYSPDLWSQLPPGAEEFTKTLDVYKK